MGNELSTHPSNEIPMPVQYYGTRSEYACGPEKGLPCTTMQAPHQETYL